MYFKEGIKKLLPLAPGVIPFGLIMGTVASEAGLDPIQALVLNLSVYAGASQLAAVELMQEKSPIFIVVVTGLIINLRMLMYSLSLAPIFIKEESLLKRVFLSYSLTDQSYAVTIAELDKIKNWKDQITFYLGTVVAMMSVWHLSTLAGYLFGNFAPKSLSLDFAVPLAFMSIVLPAIKNKNFLLVAGVSMLMSLIAHPLPFNLGLVVAGSTALIVALVLMLKSPESKEAPAMKRES